MTTWADLYRRFLTGRPGNRPQEHGIILFDISTVPMLGIGGGEQYLHAVDQRRSFSPCLTVEHRRR